MIKRYLLNLCFESKIDIDNIVFKVKNDITERLLDENEVFYNIGQPMEDMLI